MAIITTVGAWLTGMRAGRAQFITAVHAAAEQVITRLNVEVERVSAQHVKCEETLARYRDEMDVARAKMVDMETQINELMKGPVAGYDRLLRPGE